MPFTPAHAAAAYPFRRTSLILPALIAGSFAPDFEYFILLESRDRFGHTMLGGLLFSLPLALLALWLFQHVVRDPLIRLMPDAIQSRWHPTPPIRYSNPGTLAWAAASALIGVATHILWDSFTHFNTRIYRHVALLREPVIGSIQLYRLLQHGSAIVGACILAIWLRSWYRETKPSPFEDSRTLPPRRRTAILVLLPALAFLGALIRAVVGASLLHGRAFIRGFTREGATTFIAMLWWELFVYGLFAHYRTSRHSDQM